MLRCVELALSALCVCVFVRVCGAWGVRRMGGWGRGVQVWECAVVFQTDFQCVCCCGFEWGSAGRAARAVVCHSLPAVSRGSTSLASHTCLLYVKATQAAQYTRCLHAHIWHEFVIRGVCVRAPSDYICSEGWLCPVCCCVVVTLQDAALQLHHDGHVAK